MYVAEFLTVALIHLLAVASPGPDFAVVAAEFLDLLEFGGVPGFEDAVFGGAEEDVFFVGLDGVGNEGDVEDGVFVGEERFVAVTKVKSPDADVFIGGRGGDNLRVAGYAHVQDRQLMTVEIEKELERVDEEDFDGVVHGRNGKEARVG